MGSLNTQFEVESPSSYSVKQIISLTVEVDFNSTVGEICESVSIEPRVE